MRRYDGQVRAAVLVVVVAGCSFHPGGAPGDGEIDSSIDAPPTSASVHFISITPSVTTISPGLYGFDVVAVLRNDLDVPVTAVAANIAFADAMGNRGPDFRWRDADARDGVMAPQPAMVPAMGEATYHWKVDALASAIPPGPITVRATATGMASGTPISAHPLDAPPALDFAPINPTIVVNRATDELNADDQICLREAITMANAAPGLDRISFDPTVFPLGAPAQYLLSVSLGGLPPVTDPAGLVIDGSNAGITVAVNSSWDSGGRYGIVLTTGLLVIDHLRFRDLAYSFRNENITSDAGNCGSATFFDGSAIRVNGGTLILEASRFFDPDVAERNCVAASVRLQGGSGHRIINNTWTDQVMDALYVAAPTVEISNNTLNAGATPTRTDDGIFIAAQGGLDLWVTGNVITGLEYAGVYAAGLDSGALYVVNNTFARTGTVGGGGVRRSLQSRPLVARNNVYLSPLPSSVQVDDGSGTAMDLAYEATTDAALCTSCPGAQLGAGILTSVAPMVLDAAGSTAADFAPQPGSPLIDTGADLLDRNGKAPGRFNGAGPERGAVELP